MASCEMCGASGDLKETRVEGTVLDLCDDCQEMGEPVDQSDNVTQATRTTTPSRSQEPADNEVVPDFDNRVKRAREDHGLSVSGLADQLKEKDSVVRRVESGDLTPDQDLARKFERTLDITLYETPPELEGGGRDRTTTEQTIGDVAEVRERDS